MILVVKNHFGKQCTLLSSCLSLSLLSWSLYCLSPCQVILLHGPSGGIGHDLFSTIRVFPCAAKHCMHCHAIQHHCCKWNEMSNWFALYCHGKADGLSVFPHGQFMQRNHHCTGGMPPPGCLLLLGCWLTLGWFSLFIGSYNPDKDTNRKMVKEAECAAWWFGTRICSSLCPSAVACALDATCHHDLNGDLMEKWPKIVLKELEPGCCCHYC